MTIIKTKIEKKIITSKLKRGLLKIQIEKMETTSKIERLKVVRLIK